MNNRIWADKIIKKMDPSYKYRWEFFGHFITSCLSHGIHWVDIGCGSNSTVEEFGHRAKLAFGIDIEVPTHRTAAPFICADLHHLPLRSRTVDFVTLRYVVEHLQNIPNAFSEIERILKPNGQVVVMTTNLWSPFIFLPHLIPFNLKNKIVKNLFKVNAGDVQPTFHRFNSARRMKYGIGNLKLVHLDQFQDVNYVRRWLFLMFFIWHLITKTTFLKFLRTGIFAVFVKSTHSLR